MSTTATLNGNAPWASNLPKHWKLQKLKSFTRMKSSNVDKLTVEGEVPIRLCNYTDVYYKDVIHADLDFMKATAKSEEIDKFALRKGDIIVTKDSEIASDIAVPAYVPEDIDGVICGYHLAQIRPSSDEVNGKYVFYAFNSHGVRDHFHNSANGITRYGLSQHDIKSALFPLPPRAEQDAIVGYLDAKLEQIDRFITNKRHLIELLEEERQRTIHMAITRGMNPDVKLKPTGIKWLPQIPQHWEMRRNGTLFDERKQKGHEDLPVLMVSINTAVTLDRPNQVREQQQIADKEKYAFAAKNDIAFNMMRMWQGAVGVVPVDGNVSPAYVVCKPRQNVDPRYYELLFRTKLYQGEVFCYSYGIVLDRNRLYWIGFKSIFSPYPPIEEQKEIIKKISTMTKEVEEAKSKAQAEIDLINEFRTSLIAEAVTGKIEINNK